MVTNRKATTGARDVKKLKLKRETIKDLEVKGKSGDVKAGAANRIRCIPSGSGTCPGATC